MNELRSTHIRQAHYDPETMDLTVHFRNGAAYVYKDVPYDMAQRLADAPSPGSFLNRYIKPYHRFERPS